MRRVLLSLMLLGLLPMAAAAQDKVLFEKAAEVWTLPWQVDWVTSVSFLGSSRQLAAGNKIGQILVWELPEQASAPAPLPRLSLEGHSNVVTALASTPDGRWLVSASYDHSVRIWDMQAPAKGKATVVLKNNPKQKSDDDQTEVATCEAAKVLSAHDEWVRSLSLTPDGKHMLTGDDNGLVILWAFPEGRELKRWSVKSWLQAVALSPDATRAVTCEASNRRIDLPSVNTLWDVSTGKPVLDLGLTLRTGKNADSVHEMIAAGFSGDGKLLAFAREGESSAGGKLFIVDAVSGKKLRETVTHRGGTVSLKFHPDGKHLATTGRDTQVRIWRLADGKEVAVLGSSRGGQFRDWVHAVAFSADGQWCAAADMAGAVAVYSFPKP